MSTEAKREGNKNYLATQENITLRVPKGKREILKFYAADHGESLQGYIIRLIEEDSGIQIR